MSIKMRVVLICLLALLLGASCLWLRFRPAHSGGEDRRTAVQSSAVSTDADALLKIVKLNDEPLAVTWQHFTIGDNTFGPADYYLKAVVTYDPEIVRAIQAAAVEVDSSQGQIAKDILPGAPFVETWFPDPVVTHLTPSAAEPDELLIDVPIYKLDAVGTTIWADGWFFIADAQTIFVFCNTR